MAPSAFVLDSACKAAEQILTSRRQGIERAGNAQVTRPRRRPSKTPMAGAAARSLNSAWIVYFESGDVSKSIHYASMALELTPQLGDRAKETIVLSNMGA